MDTHTLICASKHNCVDAYTLVHTSNIETYGLERGMEGREEEEEAQRRGTEWWVDVPGKHIWTHHANTTCIPTPPWCVYRSGMMLRRCWELTTNIFSKKSLETNFSLSAILLVSSQAENKSLLLFYYITFKMINLDFVFKFIFITFSKKKRE